MNGDGHCPDCAGTDIYMRGYCQPCYRRRQVRGEFEFHEFVDIAWHEEAPCAYVDPDLWFPEKGESPKEAKKICRRCRVRAECLDYAPHVGAALRRLGRAVRT